MKLKLSRRWPVILWMAIIFIFSNTIDPYRFLPLSWRLPINIGNSNSSLDEFIGQVLHFFEYAVLALLVYKALDFNKTKTWKNDLQVLTISMAYALSDEIHQIFVPGRAFQLSDLLIDLLGVIAGILLFSMWYTKNGLKWQNLKRK